MSEDRQELAQQEGAPVQVTEAQEGCAQPGIWEQETQRLGARVLVDIRNRGQQVSPILASFVVRAVILQAEALGIRYDLPTGLTLAQERDIVEAAVSRFLAENDPVLETMKMQVAFEHVYAKELRKVQSKDVYEKNERTRLIDDAASVAGHLGSKEQVASLYRAIFKLLSHTAMVEEGRQDRHVDREIAAALASVFPQSGLTTFNMLGASEKRQQIEDLVPIVLGIRLFNKEIGKGGAGLIAADKVVLAEVTSLLDALERDSRDVNLTSQTYSKVVKMEFDRPGTIASPLTRIQSELTNRRQYILLVHQLLHETNESLQRVHSLNNAIQKEMANLKEVVGGRNAVPKEQVYPHFKALSQAWMDLSAERALTEMRKTIFFETQFFRDSFRPSLNPNDIELVGDIPPEKMSNDNADFEFVTTLTEGDDLSAQDPQTPVRIVDSACAEFMTLPLQYQGYCPCTVVKRAGLVLPGNPALGIIQFDRRYFSFASKEAMKNFVDDPRQILDGLETAVKRAPELIHLLCLQDQIPHSAIHNLLTVSEMHEELREMIGDSVDVGTQTPTHFVESNIDHRYEWNEWNLRRKAVQLANLTDKRTHSTQTNLSHFRRDAEVQSYLPRPNEDGSMPGQGTQTGITKGTNVEITKSYISGLRGEDSNRFREVSLTLAPSVTDHSNSYGFVSRDVHTTGTTTGNESP